MLRVRAIAFDGAKISPERTNVSTALRASAGNRDSRLVLRVSPG